MDQESRKQLPDQGHVSMTEASEPSIVKVKYVAACLSDTRTDTSVAGHVIVTDEPEVRGGTNVAAAPVQIYLSSLLGCMNVFAHKCADKLGVEITSMDFEMEAEVDRRGMMMVEAIAVPIPTVSITAHVKTNATDDQWEEVTACISQSCPIAVAIRASGTKIHENWILTRD